MNRFPAAALIGIVLLLAAGCAGPSAATSGTSARAPAGTAATASSPLSLAALQKGMSGAEIRAALGEPDSIKQFKPGVAGVDVWTYLHTYRGPTQEVVMGTRDVPHFDPFTGATSNLKEPVYSQETTFFHEKIELLVQGDTLLEWKRSVREERTHI